MSTSKKITLTSSDGQSFVIEEAVAREFGIVASKIDNDNCASGSIPLANVAAKDLGPAIEYCKTHVNAGAVENNEEAADKLKKWDDDFLADFDNPMLFSLLLAANYLNCKGLLDITCQRVADNLNDLQLEEVRKLFGVESDYTEEEEAEIRKQNEWAFK